MSEKLHNNNFHLIRLLAAIFVIISHSYTLTGLPEHDLMWKITGGHFTFSYIGLSTFFIISGYLITQSADPAKLMTTKRALSFLWRRFLRIFPALIVVVVLSVFVLGPLLTTLGQEYFKNPITWRYLETISLYLVKYDLPGVFTNNIYPNAINGSLWTLSYEFTLYLIVLLLAIFRILKLRYLILSIYLLLLYGIGVQPSENSYILPYLNMDIYSFGNFALYFAGGMILFLFKDKVPLKFHIFLLVTFLMVIGWHYNYQYISTYALLPFVIIYLANIPGRINNFALAGDFSYGIYIYAFPVQQTLVHFFGKIPTVYMIIFSILLTFPFAFLSWHLIEKKALAFKNGLSKSSYSKKIEVTG